MADKVRAGCKCVKPLLSANFCEAHTRVIGLYRAYYRFIPHLRKLHCSRIRGICSRDFYTDIKKL